MRAADAADGKGLVSSGAKEGRYAVASRDLQPGEVALRAPPLAAVLHEQYRGRRCDRCFTAGSKALARCGRCKAAFYCGRRCQEMDWKAHHKLECGLREKLQKALDSAGLGGAAALQDALLAARCARADSIVEKHSGALDELQPHAALPREEKATLQRMAAVLETTAPSLSAGLPARAEKALRCFGNNNFAVTDDLFIAVAAGCFPHGATLNHSCRPNCLLAYELTEGELPLQVVRVLEPVAAGDELTHSYVDLALPRWQRRQQLQEVYGFDCRCVGCGGGGDPGMEKALCYDASGSGAVAVGPGCPLPPAPANHQREVALAQADVLLQQAALEEDAPRELQILEEVCRLREQWLHPRHVEVCAAHASAHTAAMAAGAWAAAERHCQALVDQYVAVYPPWHPITGLQMFTLAELKEQQGRLQEAKSYYRGAQKILALTHGKGHPLVEQLCERLDELSGQCG